MTNPEQPQGRRPRPPGARPGGPRPPLPPDDPRLRRARPPGGPTIDPRLTFPTVDPRRGGPTVDPGRGRPTVDPRRGGSTADPRRGGRTVDPRRGGPSVMSRARPHPAEAPTQPVGAVGGTRRERQEARTRQGRSGRGTRRNGDDRERRRRRRRGLRVLAVLALLTLPFVVALAWFGYQLRPGSEGPAVQIEVTREMGKGDVADALAESGVIDSALAFKVYASVTGAGPFESGTYELHEGQGIRSAIDVLDAGPPQVKVPDLDLLLPPGLTLSQIADRVGELKGKSAQRFLEVAQSGTIRSRYQPADQSSLEGFLFPDTYKVGVNESEESIVQRLVNRFDQIADEVGLGGAQGLTPYEAVVAASLIEREAKLADDAPLISAVIRNRLADGQPLQIDATLCYARAQTTGSGCPPPPIEADKVIDSPYNTYAVAGLPPTPIASVTKASMTAALSPADVPYKYYVIADANGKHAFGTTLDEHERNVAAAQEKGLL